MKPRKNQSGFAMLLVLLMAAVVAIMLYNEIPRVAFEAHRQREQMLIERGEQYKRAIGLFFRDQKRYPTSMDELEKFQTRHYLRHKYVDPMTGKAEWRLVHIQNGMLTDSVNSAPGGQGQGQGQQQSASLGYVGQQAFMGSTPQTGGGSGVRGIPRPRTPGSGDPGTGSDVPPDGQPPATAPVAPGGAGTGGQPGTGGTGTPDPNQPGAQPIGGGAGAGAGPGIGGAPNSPFGQNSQQPGAGGTSAPNPAIGAIDNLLRSPRPGGLQGLTNAPPGQGPVIGGGIAGVASEADSESIMVYNDHSNYKEWEFIFDFSKWRPPPDPRGGGATGATPVNQMGPGITPQTQQRTGPGQ